MTDIRTALQRLIEASERWNDAEFEAIDIRTKAWMDWRTATHKARYALEQEETDHA